jgi:hypothetical protein
MVQVPLRGKLPFLMAREVENDDIVTVLKAPYFQDAKESKFEKERTIVEVQVKRTELCYRWGLNTTTNDRFVNKWGAEGNVWIGKEAKIQKRTENVRGQDKEVIYGLPQVPQTQASL